MRKKKNDKPIQDVLKEFVSNNKKVHQGLAQEKLRFFWKKRYGSVIDSYTEKLEYHHHVVTVHMTSSALKQELLMSSNKILKTLREAFPDIIIDGIKFK